MIYAVIGVLIVAGVAAYFAYKKVIALSGPKVTPNDLIVLQVKVPKNAEKTDVHSAPVAAERLLSNLHGLLNTLDKKSQELINFEIVSSTSGVSFYVVIPASIKSFVESQIYANYGSAQIEEVKDYLQDVDVKDKSVVLKSIGLTKKQFFPIKTFKDFEVDPISAVTEALSEVRGEDKVVLQFSIKPVEDSWQEEGYKYVEAIRGGDSGKGFSFSSLMWDVASGLKNLMFGVFTPPSDKEVKTPAKASLSPAHQDALAAIEDKLSKMGFLCEIKYLILATEKAKIDSYARSIQGSFRQFSTTNLNSLITGKLLLEAEAALNAFKSRAVGVADTYVLNTEEIASLFHFPSSYVETPNISWSMTKKLEPPLNLPIKGNVNYFGVTNFRDKQVK